MRKYTDSDIFGKMNVGNSIYNNIGNCIKSISNDCIINKFLYESLDTMNKAYKESICIKIIESVKKHEMILIHMPIDKRLPAKIPYIVSKRNGKSCVIVDLSRFNIVKRDDDGNIIECKCDINKLYNMLVPSYVALNILNDQVIVSTETTKWLAYLWAKLFNRILMGQRIFVGNQERYEAFMYFAMRFFLIYYMQTPLAIVDRISGEFIKNNKSQYILTIEANLKHKNIDIYKDWTTFSYTMFSNDVTNIRSVTNVEMNAEQYLKLYSRTMGMDGSYLALWSVDYFFYCVFITHNHANILNDRAWSDIVDDNPKIMSRILSGIYREM